MFHYFHKHANLYLRGPKIKLLQQENICSMLKDVLKGKAKVDIVKLHKSREVVPRNYKYRQHMCIYSTRVRAMIHYHDILLNCSFFKTFLFIAENFIYRRRFGTAINHGIVNISSIHVIRFHSPNSKHKNNSHAINNFNLLITRV